MLPRRSRGARRAPPVAASLLASLLAVAGPATSALTWTNVAEDAGVAFVQAGEIHGLEDLAWPAFPEIMGGGACWADFDGDGYDDLYLVKQFYNPENPNVGDWADSEDVRSRMYVNDGDGTFTDVTDTSGTDTAGFGYGCSAADFDGDGCVDLFVSNFGPSELFRNACDGTFTNATALLGPVGQEGSCGDYLCFTTSSAWADYDLDGDLDLYADNYVDTRLNDTERGPNHADGQYNVLLRNEGGAAFVDVAAQAGVQGTHAKDNDTKSLGVVWFDADLDGDPDIYVANDEQRNYFFLNLGNGTFADRSNASSLDNPFASMGVTSGDYDDDGYPDLFFTHYHAEYDGFYRNRGNLTWDDRSGEDDLDNTYREVGWGAEFVDLDRDGDEDIAACYGHTEWGLPEYNAECFAFRNDPNLTPGADPWNRNWTDISGEAGEDFLEGRVHRGVGFADYDYDGDVDLATNNNGNETAQLLEGDGVANNWLYLRLRQPGMNRDAIGARIQLDAAGSVQWQEVQAGSSYLSQNSLVADFGLGAATKADHVTVFWPGGGTTTVTDLAAGQLVRIDRALGAALNDTISPHTTLVLDGVSQAGWFRTPPAVDLQGADRGLTFVSGVARQELGVDDAPLADFAEPVALGEGVHALAYRSVDAHGNAEPLRRAVVRVDLTPPTPAHRIDGTLSATGWWTTLPMVTLSMTDALSGPDAIRFRVDGGAWQTYTGPFPLLDGVHTIAYIAADAAGNEAPPARFDARVDTVAPTVLLQRPAAGGVYLGSEAVAQVPKATPFALVAVPPEALVEPEAFPLAAAATDATSGLASLRFEVDGAPAGETPPSWFPGAAAVGPHDVRAVAADVAGHEAEDALKVLVASGTSDSLSATVRGLGLPMLAGLALLLRRGAGRA